LKSFIITVDTEGDNLWDWTQGKVITTENAHHIERFQSLCEKFGYKPVYLLNHEMVQSKELRGLLFHKNTENKCEIGMHLHAWNSPPDFMIENKFGGNPYITEYPKEIIWKKNEYLKKEIEDVFECRVVSHRAGRWATDSTLFEVLDELGILVDCSVTPGVSHLCNCGSSVAHGPDYRKAVSGAYMLSERLMEVPMTTAKKRTLSGCTVKNRLKNIIIGKDLWLRPVWNSEDELKELADCSLQTADYCEFMIHSSELMPGGSPYFQTEEAIEELYRRMEKLFSYVSAKAMGETLREYYDRRINDFI